MAMAAVEAFRDLGFFYAALIPELREGDVLRLQFLNDVHFDPNLLLLNSNEARRIFGQILADRPRVS